MNIFSFYRRSSLELRGVWFIKKDVDKCNYILFNYKSSCKGLNKLPYILNESFYIPENSTFSDISLDDFIPSNKLIGIIKFLLWKKRMPFFMRRKINIPYFFDVFKLLLYKSLNTYMPWLEASLQSHYYILQLQCIRSRRVQYTWVKTHTILLRIFSSLSGRYYLQNLKYFLFYRYHFILRGRHCKMKACRFQRVYKVGLHTMTINYSGSIGNYYTSYTDNFLTRWGVSSINYVLSVPKLI